MVEKRLVSLNWLPCSTKQLGVVIFVWNSLIFMSSAIISESTAPLYLLDGYAGATCLDGSPGAYYHRPAKNKSLSSNWIFSLQGGGECVDEQSCLDRAQDHSNESLGSSIGYAQDGSSFMVQFQNANEKFNPDFYGWNHVFVMYCTGDLHLGTVTEPGADQWGWARFSGALVVDAVLADLNSRDDLEDDYAIRAATTVVWSGDSAGGIGSAAHLDHAAETIKIMSDQPDDVRVVGAPIAGFYWNNSYAYNASAEYYVPFDTEAFAEYSKLWQMRVPEACAEEYPNQTHICALLNFSIGTMSSDIYVIEMLVDSVQNYLHGGVPEYNDATSQYIVEFGRNMTTTLQASVVQKDTQDGLYGKTGLFAASCYAHTAFYSTKPLLPPEKNTDNIFTTFSDWLFGRGEFDDHLMDECCSGSETEVNFNPTCDGEGAVHVGSHLASARAVLPVTRAGGSN